MLIFANIFNNKFFMKEQVKIRSRIEDYILNFSTKSNYSILNVIQDINKLQKQHLMQEFLL